MNESRQILDETRSAVNLLDAAQSAVDLLTRVLGTDERNLGHGSLTEQHRVATDGEILRNPSRGRSEDWKPHLSDGRRSLRGSSPFQANDDSYYYPKSSSSSSILPRAKSVTIATDEREKTGVVTNSPKRNEFQYRPRFHQTVSPKIPSQVAKVTPQQLTASASEERDVTMDYSSRGSAGGGGPESLAEGWDRGFNEFIIEQAQASSILVMENAKLREELHEAKAEVTSLTKELSKKSQVDKKESEVQTIICGHVIGDHLYLNHEFNGQLASDDEEDTDFMTYSTSSPDRHYALQASMSDDLVDGAGGANVYFYTPGSQISTPGNRTSTVSSSGGGLIRRKLELPKSLKKGGNLGTISYELLASQDSSTGSQGCCPFACFGHLGGRKHPQK
ncbi:uncharacterized protein LOC121424797 isoform X2 [Lytechinus variegatus]|uniref:uncharacterized protein LOC121424797 isoform X2 n=1 Tax=Lytechinus variegatus TaxID=7654 RepID=UPI001BB20E48|nr:uncharacterized protein LOC121424797 isoform X2 [Lytechinus variegatus]